MYICRYVVHFENKNIFLCFDNLKMYVVGYSGVVRLASDVCCEKSPKLLPKPNLLRNFFCEQNSNNICLHDYIILLQNCSKYISNSTIYIRKMESCFITYFKPLTLFCQLMDLLKMYVFVLLKF
jgi:hypothetical protein